MENILSNQWNPSPGINLDDNSLKIVKSKSSNSITAGPGAGKTELLAQRATYLLSTGHCTAPHRILAIAFKVDAAQNLKKRVEMRCDKAQASRFESLTLDAFAKRIVDQFREALPEDLIPTPNYKILFPNRNTWLEFKQDHVGSYEQLNSINEGKIGIILDKNLNHYYNLGSNTFNDEIQKIWWREQLDKNPSTLTFNMIKHLAIQILKNQSKILSLLRYTYSYVFLDEFQDVTGLQYNLIKSAFFDSDTILTAVGDENQAIMEWAGAEYNIFGKFETDFNAKNEKMRMNFRSNSRIVDLINDMASTINSESTPTSCARYKDKVPQNAVECWSFKTREIESNYLAEFISNEVNNKKRRLSDFLILARQRVDEVEKRIKQPFHNLNLKIRNEARFVGDIAIQDLVNDKVYNFLLAILKLSVNYRDGLPFDVCLNFIAEIRGADLNEEKGYSEIVQTIRSIVHDLQLEISKNNPGDIDKNTVAKIVMQHISFIEIQRCFREYGKDDRLKSIFNGFSAFFNECREETLLWTDVITNLEGIDTIRLMTIHKSKGLECHTVFFIEFNDDTFWGNDDDVKVFFVALSRARERVFFTITDDSKGITNVSEFIDSLKASNVPVKDDLSLSKQSEQ